MTTMNTGAASLSDERERAAITACALMIKGICLTTPNVEWTERIENRIHYLLRQIASTPQADADFKNFHRLLCERFDYVHDEGDWKRDQLSLIEHIASRAAIAAGGVQEARDAFDAWNDSQTALEFEDAEAENHARFIFTAGYNAAALPREAPNGWQPIETAPKDGRMFLGWVDAVRYGESDEGVQFEVNVSEQDFCRWVEHHGYFENMMGQIGDAYHVTHWMPLPAAPAASNGEQA